MLFLPNPGDNIIIRFFTRVLLVLEIWKLPVSVRIEVH